jgi:uncharacterized membrane protein
MEPRFTEQPTLERPKHFDSKVAVPDNKGIKVVKSCTINRPREELFQFWRHFENLPLFMKHLRLVTQISEKESHWIAKIGRKEIEWDSIIINEHPNELIAWRTREGSEIAHAGSVRFETAPGNRGTEVTIAFEYEPPSGKAAAFVSKLFGKEPGQIVEKDLMCFKALMETGEIPTTDGQPTCREGAE